MHISKNTLLIMIFIEILFSIYFFISYTKLPDEYSGYALAASLGWGLYAITNFGIILLKKEIKKVFDIFKENKKNSEEVSKQLNSFEEKYLK